VKLTLHQFDLPLRRAFTISRGSTTVYRALIVELEQDGVCGYGEAGENAFYGATIRGIRAALEAVRPLVEKGDPADPATLWRRLADRLENDRFAQCALDTAAWDLCGKLQEKPLWKLWGLSTDRLPASDYTIGIDSIEVMVAKMREFAGWPIYKIKLGTPDDLEIVRGLRRHTDAVLRVDANGAWGVEQTLRNAALMKDLGVEFIEQPLAADDWQGMGRVRAESALPVVADESCRVEGDVRRCGQCFHGVNVKLVKCGGLTPAKRMLEQARALGLKTMVGCMTESTVGISAIAQLLPLVDYADMDGALLLAEDVATGITIERGRVRFSSENGCGARLL